MNLGILSLYPFPIGHWLFLVIDIVFGMLRDREWSQRELSLSSSRVHVRFSGSCFRHFQFDEAGFAHFRAFEHIEPRLGVSNLFVGK
jgi:hypothetical protein